MNNSGACSTIVEDLRDMLTQERSARIQAEFRATEAEFSEATEAESQAAKIASQLQQSNLRLREYADALEHEVQRAKAVFDSAAEGIIIFDDSGLIESMNKAAEKYLWDFEWIPREPVGFVDHSRPVRRFSTM
jgi:PAS domain-containing protein